jgi:hypothetical protein
MNNKYFVFYLQRKTSADKSRNIVKGRRISQVERDGKKASLLFCIFINLF